MGLLSETPGAVQAKTMPASSRLAFYLGLALFIILVIARLQLPFRHNDSMALYNSVAWAVDHKQNWGKQALVAALEYSPLPAAVLTLGWPLAWVFRTGVGQFLVAISQVGALFLLYRTARHRIRSKTLSSMIAVGGLCLIASGTVPGNYLLNADPFWLCVLPCLGAFHYLSAFERWGRLREAAGLALCCALLVFCGLIGQSLGFVLLVAFCILGRQRLRDSSASPALILMPYVYAWCLLFAFNLLIMGDAFFAVRRIAAFLAPGQGVGLGQGWKVGVLGSGAVALGLAVLSCRSLCWRVACLASLSLIPTYLLRKAGMVHVGGEFLFASSLIAMLAMFAALEAGARKLIATVVSCIVVLGIWSERRHACVHEGFLVASAPHRDELVAFVDQYWDESRILVFGLRTSAMYCCTDSELQVDRDRFVGRLDWNESVLRKQIQGEQFHLLLPPNTGLYYPRGSFFSKLHQSENPGWLFLEQVWGEGDESWQLWRCIRRRTHEGPLD